MAKGNFKIRIKTTQEKFEVTDPVTEEKKIVDAVKKVVVSKTISSVVGSFEEMIARNYRILATFFFRVCCRTPIDEAYEGYRTIVTADGQTKRVHISHYNDEEQIRLRWYLKNRKGTLTSQEIWENAPEVFDDINNIRELLVVEEMIKEKFGLEAFNAKGELNVTIGNSSKYFDKLEYGGYKRDSEPLKAEYEHGVENLHSVQAPMGMLRITQAELPSIIDFPPAFDDKYYQKVDLVLEKTKVRELMNKMNKGRINLADIKRYIERY